MDALARALKGFRWRMHSGTGMFVTKRMRPLFGSIAMNQPFCSVCGRPARAGGIPKHFAAISHDRPSPPQCPFATLLEKAGVYATSPDSLPRSWWKAGCRCQCYLVHISLLSNRAGELRAGIFTMPSICCSASSQSV